MLFFPSPLNVHAIETAAAAATAAALTDVIVPIIHPPKLQAL